MKLDSLINGKLYPTGFRAPMMFCFSKSDFTWAFRCSIFSKSSQGTKCTLRYCSHLRSSFGVQLASEILTGSFVLFSTQSNMRVVTDHTRLLRDAGCDLSQVPDESCLSSLPLGTSECRTICFSTSVCGRNCYFMDLKATTQRMAWASSPKCCWATGSSSGWIRLDCLMDFPLLGRATLLARSLTSSLLSPLAHANYVIIALEGTSGAMICMHTPRSI